MNKMRKIIFDGIEYNEVQSITGRVWLDRNLGAKYIPNGPFDFDPIHSMYDAGFSNKLPKGYRIPHSYEWAEELNANKINNIDTAFNSFLKLPATVHPRIDELGWYAFYISSDYYNPFYYGAYLDKNNAFVILSKLSRSGCIRLIKEEIGDRYDIHRNRSSLS
jgi:hypothetical protein